MGRKSTTGGVIPSGNNRIRLDFKFAGVRYRPTLLRFPSETNLRWARRYLQGIKQRIINGTFSFAEEFPEYRHLRKVPDQGSPRTCAQVFDAYLTHCASRVLKSDLAPVTIASYRRVLNGFWRPRIGTDRFLEVRYSKLIEIADNVSWSKKSYNNAISVLRHAFKFGYRDHPVKDDPTLGLKSVRIRKKDRPVIDPFTIQEAETLIAALHRDWGEAQGNYDEFRFFTGLRRSEQIALVVGDFDPNRRTLTINKARVAGIDKDSTKTGEDRQIVLCPRALNVLHRQLALRTRLEQADKIKHDHLFFKADGEPIRNLEYPYVRWRHTLMQLRGIRYRKPYCARHSSVSWNLMSGCNPLWVAKQHGHSITTMLRVYAAWAEGAIKADLKAIKRAMRSDPADALSAESSKRRSATTAQRRTPPGRTRPQPGPSNLAASLAVRQSGGELSTQEAKDLTGGERGIRTLEGLLTLTPLAGVRLRPLGHLSVRGL
jgi:integrase